MVEHHFGEMNVRVVAKILQERGEIELYAALMPACGECDCDHCSLDGDDAADLFHDLLMLRMQRNVCSDPTCGTGLMWDEHNEQYHHSHAGGTLRGPNDYGVSTESVRPENL